MSAGEKKTVKEQREEHDSGSCFPGSRKYPECAGSETSGHCRQSSGLSQLDNLSHREGLPEKIIIGHKKSGLFIGFWPSALFVHSGLFPD